MKFRTEIEIKRNPDIRLDHHSKIVMLGSCFTDNVGALLLRDGFGVCANPMGTLYNPLSISNAISKSLFGHVYDQKDFEIDEVGCYHCLDFCTQYSDSDTTNLAKKANADITELRNRINEADTMILTLGTAYVYNWDRNNKYYVVGNCHKFPASCFQRSMIGQAEVRDTLHNIASSLPRNVKNLILTVSPIRHIGDGLHCNQLSKATLLLGIDEFLEENAQLSAAYFPSYEIMIDDLRDYRFYAADMKHPSDVAIDYIYQAFCDTYMTKETMKSAADARQKFLRSQHRQILNND